MSLYIRRKRRTDINVIPLIDVMTVLIVFLLLTTKFDDTESLSISLPRAESAAKSGQNSTSPIVLAIDKSGALFLNSRSVSRESASAELEALSKQNPGSTLFVVADEAAPTKDTVFALDRAQLAGIPCRLVTRSDK